MTKYYPVLRWKKGEENALANTNPQLRENIIPIIEFPLQGQPRLTRGESIDSARTRQQMSYMSKIMQFQEKLYRAWNNNNIMLDIFSVLNQHNFTITTSDLRAMFSNNLNIIPLINLNHINDELIDFLYQLRIENFIQTVSFRINSETPPQSNAFISTICERLNINPITTTIIYDLGNISEQNYVYFERMFRSLFNDFSYPHNNLVILSGSFYIPIDMSSNSNCTIARNDWIFWLQLQSTLELTSNFGDYTVSPVLFQDIPFRGAPKIKYTLENNWYISKGTTPRTYDQRNAVQFRSLAEQILQSSDWTNLNCYGDQQLNDCANGNIEIGSPTKWVTVSTNRHIASVMNQMNATHFLP
ncbi:beta family protein [uncultured Phascolarctobacterium sp.]|uniref:beta family protein n=1 Tax=uncultured Phascolarctobacterium sp. TaxID=512296 RepID=UPI002597808E|nr:hypothetical protein [uncultured Phascolarctobacterium sp.]